MTDNGRRWIDRPAVLFLAAQTIGLIIWGASLNQRVIHAEEALDDRAPLVARFIAAEAQLHALSVSLSMRLDRLERKVDYLVEVRRAEAGGIQR